MMLRSFLWAYSLSIVDDRNIQTCREFLYEIIWAKLMRYAQEQALKCSRERQFCGFFYAFGIKEGTWGWRTWGWEKARPISDHGVLPHVRGRGARGISQGRQWTGLVWGRDKPPSEEVTSGVWRPSTTLPVRDLRSDHHEVPLHGAPLLLQTAFLPWPGGCSDLHPVLVELFLLDSFV